MTDIFLRCLQAIKEVREAVRSPSKAVAFADEALRDTERRIGKLPVAEGAWRYRLESAIVEALGKSIMASALAAHEGGGDEVLLASGLAKELLREIAVARPELLSNPAMSEDLPESDALEGWRRYSDAKSFRLDGGIAITAERFSLNHTGSALWAAGVAGATVSFHGTESEAATAAEEVFQSWFKADLLDETRAF